MNMKYLTSILIVAVIYLFSPNRISAQHSLSFNGEDAYADIEQKPAINFEDSFTIEFWVKADDLSSRFPVFSTRVGNHAGAFEIEVGTGYEGSGRISVTGRGVYIFDSANHQISEGRWVHIAYTRWGDGKDDQALYVNGQSVSHELSTDYTVHNNSEPYRLASNGTAFFQGNLNELRIWDTARSQEKILAHINQTLSGNESGLIGYWPIHEGSGTTISDESSKDDNGTLHGGTEWSTDLQLQGEQYSVQFDGEKAFAEIVQQTGINFEDQFTIEFWVKADELSGRNPVFSTRKEDHHGAFQVELGTGSDGKDRVSVSGHGTWISDHPNDAIQSDQWTHIAYKRDSSEGLDLILVNGVILGGTIGTTYNIINNSDPYQLATNYTSEYFKGNITELRIWDTVRSNSEIHHNMSEVLTGKEEHLAGYWRFSEGSGANFFDLTSNGNHGTLKEGAEWSSNVHGASASGITGIDLDTGSGDIKKTVSDKFTAFGLTLTPAHNELTLEYNSSEEKFTLYGRASVTVDGHEIDVSMGHTSDPGLVIENKLLKEFNMSITTDFTLYGLKITPHDLTFKYNSSAREYQVYGSLAFKMENENVTANMGSESNPGLIVEGGKVKQVNLGITENFSLAGLEIDTHNLGMEWKKVSGEDLYHIYGDADFSVDRESVGASFGTPDHPGIIIHNSHLKELDIAINSDLHLGNITLITKDLKVDYNADKEHIFVSGEVEIKEVFELIADLGSGNTEGLIIDVSGSEPRFKVEDLTIEIDHADLGVIDLKLFKLHFNEHGIIESDVEVVFAGGDGFGGKIKFTDTNPVHLEEIEIFYFAEKLEDALEIFEDVQVNYISGTLENLDKPSDLKVSADIQIFYGGGETIDGYSATMLQSGMNTTIDKTELHAGAYLNVGAYRSDGWDDHISAGHSPPWDHLIGHGRVTFKLDFATKKVAAWAHVEDIPLSMPFLGVNAYVGLSEKSLDFLGEIVFDVPDISVIPKVIRGKKFTKVDGALRYRYKQPWNSYAAAWVGVSGLGDIGAAFNFLHWHVHEIGTGTVKGVKRNFHSDTAKRVAGAEAKSYTQSVHTFEIEQPAPSHIYFEADWYTELDSVMVTVMGPEGFYNLDRVVITDEGDEETVPELDFIKNLDVVRNDDSVLFLVNAPDVDRKEQKFSPMIDGRYHVIVSYPGNTPDSTGVNVFKFWQKPEIELFAEKNETNKFDLDLNYRTSISDSTYITIHVTDSLSTQSGKVIAHLDGSSVDMDNYGSVSYEYTPNFVPDADSIYFYAVIEDGVNPPVKTGISEAHHHKADIFGSIKYPGGSGSEIAGRRVFLDENGNGSFDIESTGGLENFGISSQTGYFSIHNVTHGEHELRIVLPRGYRITGTENRYGHIDLNFDGTPVELEIEIETYTEAES